MAVESMSTLNKNGATLMRRYECHGATDITGFGLLGHAENLAQVQKEPVDYFIHSLPILDGMTDINSEVMDFKLTKGFSAETSGGLFVMVPPDKVSAFQNDLKNEFG